MAKLFIVESPGKLKTLRQILGREWILEASVGHTTELAQDGSERMGFEVLETHVETRYVPRGDRGRQVLAKLRQAVKKADQVYLATDPDREGEAIAWHLVEQLRLKNYHRVTYTQITESAVKKAIQNPRGLDWPLIAAQRARQCLDKWVGYQVSPLLWNSSGGKSAGRVQSATLHLICERERERLNFRPEDYWVLKCQYQEGFEAFFERAEAGEEDVSRRVKTEDEAKLLAEVARTSPHIVGDCEKKDEFRNPPPPFITSSLQQMAGVRFRYSPKKTMDVAQELYEGVGGKGLITYMRTDSIALSPEFVHEARDWVKAHSPESLGDKPHFFRPKSDAQGAHEAIRPTSVSLTPEQAKRILNRDQLNLYTMIWERSIATQCKPARISKTRITIHCAETRWIARGNVVLDPGYLKFWKNTEDDHVLPSVRMGQRLGFKDVVSEKKTTQPPPRYSEPKLVQLMEKKGIGRPSTYASTIATLKDRDYVVLEKSLLAPTELGMSTDEVLMKAMPDLVDTDFTAKMETSLDDIAEGKLQWEKYLWQWGKDYLKPAVAQARKLLGLGDRPVRSPRAKSAGGGEDKKTSPARVEVAPEKVQAAQARARELGTSPICAQGHGPLELRVSKKGGFYWKCMREGCEVFAWYQDFSDRKCTSCDKLFEKVPSRKVTGGYFLKCAANEAHAQDVVVFLDGPAGPGGGKKAAKFGKKRGRFGTGGKRGGKTGWKSRGRKFRPRSPEA